MLFLLAAPAFALDCGVLADAEVCNMVNSMVTEANATFGPSYLADTASRVQRRPITIYNAMVDVKTTAVSGSCTVDGWIYTQYNTKTAVVTGTSDSVAGGAAATITGHTRAGRRITAVSIGGAGEVGIGEAFGFYNNSNKVGANMGANGFVMGKWIRKHGRKGVQLGLYGTCPSTANTPFNTWFEGGELVSRARPAGTLYACSRDGTDLTIIDPFSGLVSSIPITGALTDGCTGMARDPSDGTTYVITKTNRDLARLDLITGVATLVGSFPDAMSSLAFDSTGNLFATTGSGAGTQNRFWSVDKATAASTIVGTLQQGSTSDGEVAGFNPSNNRFYKASGNGTIDLGIINPATGFSEQFLPGAVSMPNGEEITATTWDGASGFYAANISEDVLWVPAAPPYTQGAAVGSNTGGTLKGLVFIPAP